MYLISERVGFAARRGFIIMQNDEPQTFFLCVRACRYQKGSTTKPHLWGTKFCVCQQAREMSCLFPDIYLKERLVTNI